MKASVIDNFISWLMGITNAIQSISETWKQSAEELIEEYNTIKLRNINDTDEKYHLLLNKYCSCLENEFNSMPISLQSLALLIQIHIKLTIKDYDNVVSKSRQYHQLFGTNEEINFIYGSAIATLNNGVHNEYKALRWMMNKNIQKFKFVKDAQKMLLDIQNNVCKNFLNYDYIERRFLIVSNSITYFESENFIVLSKYNLPSDIKFPIGHPQENELYICHPYDHNLYIPYTTCEFELFKSKMSELRRILQAFGATQIKILDKKNCASCSNKKIHAEVDAGTSIQKKEIGKAFGTSVSLKGSYRSDDYENLQQQYDSITLLEPREMPYLPKNLTWYHYEPEWQELYEMRLNGLIHHKITISIAKETQIGRQKQINLQIDYCALIQKVNGNLEIDTESMFNDKNSSEWTLEVEFAPLDTLKKQIGE